MTLLLLLASGVLVITALTPGAIRPLTTAQVCAIRWGVDVRHVTPAMKRHVFEAYRIPLSDRHLYVVDHLISREIAGADVVRNLWPQPIAEAKVKDRLENRLRALTCAGAITLEVAQQAIRTDWRAAYRTYLGNVPPTLAGHHQADQPRRNTVTGRHP